MPRGSAASRPVHVATSSSPREERRLLKLEATRSQVLDIAERAFAEAGYQGTSLKVVADRCEFSVGTLYSLFLDKQDLFQSVINRRGDALSTMIDEIVGAELAPDEKLIRLAQDQVRFFRQFPDWARITTAFITPGPRLNAPGGPTADAYEAGYRRAMDRQAAVIATGQKTGVIRAGSPQALARMFSAIVSMHHVIDEEAAAVGMAFSIEELSALIRAAFVVPGAGRVPGAAREVSSDNARRALRRRR